MTGALATDHNRARVYGTLVLLLLVGGLFLRFYDLTGQSLWYDEGVSLEFSQGDYSATSSTGWAPPGPASATSRSISSCSTSGGSSSARPSGLSGLCRRILGTLALIFFVPVARRFLDKKAESGSDRLHGPEQLRDLLQPGGATLQPAAAALRPALVPDRQAPRRLSANQRSIESLAASNLCREPSGRTDQPLLHLPHRIRRRSLVSEPRQETARVELLDRLRHSPLSRASRSMHWQAPMAEVTEPSSAARRTRSSPMQLSLCTVFWWEPPTGLQWSS